MSSFTGSLWFPSPMAMKELWKGSPSIVPRTLTRPRVPKNSADFGQITYVWPPFAGLFRSFAVKRMFRVLGPAGIGRSLPFEERDRGRGERGGDVDVVVRDSRQHREPVRGHPRPVEARVAPSAAEELEERGGVRGRQPV